LLNQAKRILTEGKNTDCRLQKNYQNFVKIPSSIIEIIPMKTHSLNKLSAKKLKFLSRKFPNRLSPSGEPLCWFRAEIIFIFLMESADLGFSEFLNAKNS